MATRALPTAYGGFVRTLRNCPYQARCPYKSVCRYVAQPTALSDFLSDVRYGARSAAQTLLGMACLVVGVVMSVTLVLIPVGVPLALMGVALLMTAGERRS